MIKQSEGLLNYTHDHLLLHSAQRELGVVLHHRLFFCGFCRVFGPERRRRVKSRNSSLALLESERTENLLKVKPLFFSASSARRSNTKQTCSPEPDFSLEGGKSTFTP